MFILSYRILTSHYQAAALLVEHSDFERHNFGYRRTTFFMRISTYNFILRYPYSRSFVFVYILMEACIAWLACISSLQCFTVDKAFNLRGGATLFIFSIKSWCICFFFFFPVIQCFMCVFRCSYLKVRGLEFCCNIKTICSLIGRILHCQRYMLPMHRLNLKDEHSGQGTNLLRHSKS